ncbi:MAG: hypothetical protein ABSD44_07795 [Terracidiphilus sp.]
MKDSSSPISGHSLAPGSALVSSSAPAAHVRPVTGLQRAADAMRMALPIVQRLLPLLDGNVGSAVSNLLNVHSPAPPPPPPVNLAPIEDGLAALHAQHRDLHSRVLEQNESLKHGLSLLEAQLELVSQATGHNTLAQQEFTDELKAVGDRVIEMNALVNKAKLFALIVVGLLAVSIAVNVLLLLHFRHVLP